MSSSLVVGRTITRRVQIVVDDEGRRGVCIALVHDCYGRCVEEPRGNGEKVECTIL